MAKYKRLTGEELLQKPFLRMTVERKLAIILALRQGKITPSQLREKLNVSKEELLEWTTRAQQGRNGLVQRRAKEKESGKTQ